MNKSDFIAVYRSPADVLLNTEGLNSMYVRTDMISGVKEVYAKENCECGSGNCEHGTHYYDDLYVMVEGTWYFAGRFDYDEDIDALDRLSGRIERKP